MDTKDILFICGGAFIDLDRQVSERTHEASLGFGNPVRPTGFSIEKLHNVFLALKSKLGKYSDSLLGQSAARVVAQCSAALAWIRHLSGERWKFRG